MLEQENAIKRIVKKILRCAGWEVYRADATFRPFMRHSLKWLSDHGFHFNTVLDVGASDGRWSKECMTFYPDAKYILFEPNPFFGKALDDFAESCKQVVIPIKKAVGASEGYALFSFDVADPDGGSLGVKEGYKTIKIGITTIDATLSRSRVEAPYLLKLDTHGFERSILEGASSTLEKTDVLIIEAYNYKITDEVFLFWELCAFISSKGFRPIDLVNVRHRLYDNSLWQMDLVFIRSTWEGFNYVSYK